MPIKNSAKKAVRQDARRAKENLVFKNAYKKAIKAVTKALAAKEDTKDLLVAAQKNLDKAAKKGVIKPNTAARRLSRLTKRVAAASK